MAGKSRIVLIAAAVLAAGAMAISNTLLQRLDPKEQERIEREAEQQKAAAAAKATPLAAQAATNPVVAASSNAAPRLATWGQDVVLGNKSGKTEIDVRWRWTPAVQADPSKVENIVDALQKGVPDARIHVINVDETPEEATGLFVNGENRAQMLPDGRFPPLTPQILQAMTEKH